ncbi:fungal-specific transcription factor domain-containing protein, partial [Aspergillus spectabilis]
TKVRGSRLIAEGWRRGSLPPPPPIAPDFVLRVMGITQPVQRQPKMPSSGTDTSSKPRHRASVACTSCRERRTRCVVPTGQTSCTQCQEAGQQCVIKNDDQRRKPVSKAYVSQLEEQLEQLENALRERDNQTYVGTAVSGGNHESPPHCAQPEPEPPALPMASLATPGTPQAMFMKPQNVPAENQNLSSTDYPPSPLTSTLESIGPDIRKSSMAHRLLSSRGHVSFDQLAGQGRYFGPTTNCHIYLDIGSESEESRRQAREQGRRTQRVLSGLPQPSQDYLMRLFWKHYNAVIRVVDQEAFEAGRDAGGGPFYSGFLHICILAAGYRFADKQRPDMLRIALPGRESLLHREAKYMLDYEMERPGGLPSIAALLLLGDLEVGCGRDNAGWLYSGMAYRLCFDVGLHLDRSGSGLSQRDIGIGRMTLWACVIFDRYWALFLGRPTALKPDDLEIYELSQQFDKLGTSPPTSEDKTLELQIYQALFELMEMAGKCTSISSRSADHERVMYLRMAALDSELEKWYARLPKALQYTTQNAASAPPSFFLLHQQYYSTMIMLHRPFAGYDDILDSRGDSNRKQSGQVKHLSALSQGTCTTCAGRIAQIFWQQRRRFDTRRIFVTGLQHAGNAATALVAAIASTRDMAANDRSMRYLECLVAVLDDMSEPYQPAEQMAKIYKTVLQELRELQPALQLSNFVVPARRGSSADCDSESEHAPAKRGPSTRAQQTQTLTQPQAMHSMSWPGDQQLPQLSTMMPSPALTEKPAARTRRISGHQTGLMADSGVNATSIDDSWSIFSAPDRYAIGNVMADQDPCYSSWPGVDTPSFIRLGNESAVEPSSINSDFMLIENPERPVADGMPDPSVIAQRAIPQPTTTGFSSQMASGRGYRPPKRKSPGGLEDSIWTEIVS